MLIDFDFHVTQLRYLKAAVVANPTFRPDGLDGPAFATLLTDSGTDRLNYVTKKTDFDVARSTYRQAVNDGHDAATATYASMKSRYRKDAASLSTINNLPVDDQSAADTKKRMEQTTALWAKLPLIGTPPALFLPWPGMAKTDFDLLLTAISTQQAALPDIDQAFQKAEGDLHERDADNADVATAALIQGRAQFRSGTAREMIDAVPTAPAQQAPNQALISAANSPAPGQAHLVYDAQGGTSFDILHKAPGTLAFIKVADDVIERTYNASGLPSGVHEYKIVPRNSVGDGPVSAVSSITVA